MVACKDHPSVPAVARCASCGRALCDACYRFRLDARPACARCAYEASTRPQRRVSLAVAFLCFAWGGGFWLARRYGLWDDHAILVGAGAVLAPVVAYFLAASAAGAQEQALERRDPGDDAPPEEVFRGSSPYRAYARRAILAVSPRLSGKATALVVGASLAAAAVLLPVTLHLPRWIEGELVLAAWWIIVSVTLVVLLYRGFRLRDDLVFFLPWDRPAKRETTPAAANGSSWGDGCSSVDGGCVDLDGEGCVGVLGFAAVLALALGAAWVFVELAMPLAFFLTYWLFMRAIGRVANDHHGCDGDAARSIGWGVLWATIYVLPLAGITWIFHALHR